MAERIIHFGLDDCYRVQVLRAAGYDVRQARSLIEVRTDLNRGNGVAAVIVLSDEARTAEEAATLAGNTPVILFRRGTRTIDERKFDCILDCTVSPAIWLSQLAEVIARSGKLQEEALKLEESQRQSDMNQANPKVA